MQPSPLDRIVEKVARDIDRVRSFKVEKQRVYWIRLPPSDALTKADQRYVSNKIFQQRRANVIWYSIFDAEVQLYV